MKIAMPLTALLVLLAPLLASCLSESSADTAQSSVRYSVLLAGERTLSGKPENRKLEVFSNQTSFDSSLYLYVLTLREQTVDFSMRRVALLSLGERPSGGYSISAESIEDFGAYLKARIVLKKPGARCIVTQSITSPYQFIEIESVKDLIFEERVEVVDCQ